MPRYAYQKPRAKVYAYNFGYMSNYYKPMTHYLNKETHHPSERPGAQSLAERLKKFPLDGSIYPDRDVGYYPSTLPPREVERQVAASPPWSEVEEEPKPAAAMEHREQEPEKKVVPLQVKHPYRLPVEDEKKTRPIFHPVWLRHPWDWECIWIPPHESCITPHFGLESAYELITRFLRLKPHLKQLTLQ